MGCGYLADFRNPLCREIKTVDCYVFKSLAVDKRNVAQRKEFSFEKLYLTELFKLGGLGKA